MKEYLNLVSQVLESGTKKTNRTGTDTLMVFGYHYKINLQDGFPLITTKKVYFNSVIRSKIDTRCLNCHSYGHQNFECPFLRSFLKLSSCFFLVHEYCL